MELRRTENERTGATRYYVEGRRVSRDAFEQAKFWRRLDTVYSFRRGEKIIHVCHVSKA